SPQRAKELRGFSAVLGLAMGHERPPLESFDFLKPKKQISKRVKRLKKAPIAIGAAILLIGTVVLLHFRIVQPARAEAEKVRIQAEKLQSIEKPYKEFIKQVNALEDWKKSEQYWPEVIVELTRVFPPEQRACVDRIDLDVRNAGRSTMRDAYMGLKLRVAEAGMVNVISELLRAMGCEDVEPGPETPRGFRGAEETYRFDTGVRATLPRREPRNWEDEAGDSEGTLADETVNDEEASSEESDMENGQPEPDAVTTIPASPAPAPEMNSAPETTPKQAVNPRTGGER
ncbi:MAG TPA: hypothetical protein VNT79_02050, partial [Phycisphaerae bacterium]|nr:hypothetical protein [Phycisphaerae bacterium]